MKKTTTQKRENSGLSTLLKSAKLKVTPARVAILRVLAASRVPMRPETVAKKVGKTVDTATVYRTLKSLKQARVLRQVDFEHDHAHYEIVAQNHHDHLVCTNCGKVEDFENCGSERFVKTALAQAKNFDAISYHSLELFGVCRECTARGVTA